MEGREYGFLAGLITGEGCFCLAVQRVAERKGKLRITPLFNLFMSDRETVMYAAELMRSEGTPLYIQERPKAGRDQVGIHIAGHKRMKALFEWFDVWSLTGQKHEAALLVSEFVWSRDKQPNGSPYTERELQIVRDLRQVNGNTRGKKTPI